MRSSSSLARDGVPTPQYTTIDLGAFPGQTSSGAQEASPCGLVVGASSDVTTPGTTYLYEGVTVTKSGPELDNNGGGPPGAIHVVKSDERRTNDMAGSTRSTVNGTRRAR